MTVDHGYDVPPYSVSPKMLELLWSRWPVRLRRLACFKFFDDIALPDQGIINERLEKIIENQLGFLAKESLVMSH